MSGGGLDCTPVLSYSLSLAGNAGHRDAGAGFLVGAHLMVGAWKRPRSKGKKGRKERRKGRKEDWRDGGTEGGRKIEGKKGGREPGW